MRLYTVLWVAVAAAFGLTLVLDMTQQKTVSKDKIVIAFASMWAPGEPMMKGYEQLFRRFEQEHPGYEVEPRWDGRWVLSALRPRLLTGTNIPHYGPSFCSTGRLASKSCNAVSRAPARASIRTRATGLCSRRFGISTKTVSSCTAGAVRNDPTHNAPGLKARPRT